MNITKYGHACLFLKKNNAKIIVDPGEFTELPDDISGVVAVVVTHPHGDHLSVQNVQKIVAQNPSVQIYGVAETIDAFNDVSAEKIVVTEDCTKTIGDFNVAFYFGDHATIYKTSPCQNIGLKVDEDVYYPGDSLRTIDTPVRVLAVPVSAPWLKTSEYIDFARAMKAEVAFPTHNGLLNDAGHGAYNTWLTKGLEGTGIEVKLLKNGESL